MNAGMKISTILAGLALFCIFMAGGAAQAGNIDGSVNINTASAEELQLLPGIGLSKAKAIMEYRAKHRFTSTEELLKVKGIGKALYKKVRANAVTSGQTTAKVPKKKKGKK
jgi:competence protein ComEA